jgi:hypothetical protein
MGLWSTVGGWKWNSRTDHVPFTTHYCSCCPLPHSLPHCLAVLMYHYSLSHLLFTAPLFSCLTVSLSNHHTFVTVLTIPFFFSPDLLFFCFTIYCPHHSLNVWHPHYLNILLSQCLNMYFTVTLHMTLWCCVTLLIFHFRFSSSTFTLWCPRNRRVLTQLSQWHRWVWLSDLYNKYLVKLAKICDNIRGCW